MSDWCYIFPANTKLWEDPNAKIEYPKPILKINQADFRRELKARFPDLDEEGSWDNMSLTLKINKVLA